MNDETKNEVITGTLKGLIGAIPFAGTAINEAMFDIRGRIKQERINNLVEEISLKVEGLGRENISEEFIKSEEFGDMFEKVVRESTSRKMHENLSIVAGISVKCMQQAELLSHPFLEQTITSIASLNESELAILKHLRNYNEANQKKVSAGEKEIDFKLDYSQNTVLGLDINIFRACFDSLISKGLMMDDSVGRYGGGQRDYIKPSFLGVEIYKIIDELLQEPE